MERATERALKRAGHTTRFVDDRNAGRLLGHKLAQSWTLAQAKRFEADFVFLSECQALEPETVAKVVEGRHSAMWYYHPQLHKSAFRPDVAHVLKIGKLAETFFVPGFDAEWRALGLPAKFLPSAADRDIKPVSPKAKRFDADIAFIGSGEDEARAAFLIKVAKKYDLKVWGEGWGDWKGQLKWSGRRAEGETFAAVCSSAKIVLGASQVRPRGRSTYTSDRTWMTILAGGFYLGHGTPGLTALLREGDHCAWYTDVDSCIAKCSYYLANPADRQRMRREGQVFVREHHTYDQRIHNLLSGEAFVNPLS